MYEYIFYRSDEMLDGVFHRCHGDVPGSLHIWPGSVLLETV